MNRESKVLIIHHNDLDGYGCAVILRAFFKNSRNYPASFYDIDQKLQDIEYDNYEYVFVVDVHPTKVDFLDLSDKIILIDHHPSTYGNVKKNRYVVSNKKKCATYLVWHYLKKTFPENKFDFFKNFVYCVNEFDEWTNRTPKGKCLNELLYGPYGADKAQFITRFKKGNTRFTTEELDFVKKRREDFKKIYKDLDIWELEKTNSCFVMSDDFVNDLAHKLMHEDGYDVAFIKQIKKDRVSVRTKSDIIDTGKILESLGYGGGHAKASGFFENDPIKLKEKILRIEQEILKITSCQGSQKIAYSIGKDFL